MSTRTQGLVIRIGLIVMLILEDAVDGDGYGIPVGIGHARIDPRQVSSLDDSQLADIRIADV